jgi:hypothetical protein
MWLMLYVSAGLIVSQAPVPPGPRATPAWEYKVVEDTGPPFDSEDARDAWADRLAKFSQEGWELTAVASRRARVSLNFVADVEPGYFYFKRAAKPGLRPRWEYKLLDLGDLLQPIPLGRQPDRVTEAKALDRLGRESAESWELAAVFSDRVGGFQTHRRYFLLKRTKR